MRLWNFPSKERQHGVRVGQKQEAKRDRPGGSEVPEVLQEPLDVRMRQESGDVRAQTYGERAIVESLEANAIRSGAI